MITITTAAAGSNVSCSTAKRARACLICSSSSCAPTAFERIFIAFAVSLLPRLLLTTAEAIAQASAPAGRAGQGRKQERWNN